jgi:hypothetical protein
MPKRPNSKKDTHYFYLSSDALINSCPIPKLHVKKGKNAHVLAIEAQVTMKLSEYLKKAKVHMEYTHAEKMIHCIGNQLKKLEANEYGIPSFNLDDITVFFILKPETKNANSDSESDDDDNQSGNDKDIIYDPKYDIYFAITNDDKVCTFDNKYNDNDNDTTNERAASSANPIHDQQLIINSPFKQEYITPTSSYQKNKVFISPEFEKFIKTKELPYHIHFKSGYYSFGLLCIYCFLTKKNITFVRQDTKTKVFKEHEDCLLNEDDEKDKPTHKPNSETLSITYVLQTIINTKIYWFLIRVLNRIPSERQYICM